MRRMRNSNFRIKLSVVMFFVILIASCNGKIDEKDYLQHFKERRKDFEVIKDYLLSYYGKDSVNKYLVRMIFVNPNFQTPTLEMEIVEENLTRLMEQVGVSEIHMEKENETCDSLIYFDKLYFKYYQKGYPSVYFIYDTCVEEEINYRSETIRKVSISDQWLLLIDSNFP